MPDTTVTVRQDGTGDYTTITSAEAAANVSTGYYKIEIDDSNTYNEIVSLNPSGTPTSSNYLWLTVSEGNRHSGVSATSGHARVAATASAHNVQMTSDYARVEYLEIYSSSTYYPIYVSNNYTLVSRCIVKGANDALACVYVTSAGNYNYFDNCVIYQNDIGVYVAKPNSGTRNVYFDYCTIVDSDVYFNIYFFPGSPQQISSNIYNVALGLAAQVDISVNSTYSAQMTHNGSHNAWDTDTIQFYSSTGSYTNSQDISSGGVTTVTTTANAMIVTSLTAGSEDFTPVPATGAGSNLLLGNGTNRQGSEPDSRQDFSTDIRGAARPTTAGKIDIGAFQITTAAGFKYWDGSAWADSTAVQYWNGSAWTDVTGIQYWNGSAWTDPS